jgi:hypothetical protein
LSIDASTEEFWFMKIASALPRTFSRPPPEDPSSDLRSPIAEELGSALFFLFFFLTSGDP